METLPRPRQGSLNYLTFLNGSRFVFSSPSQALRKKTKNLSDRLGIWT